MIQNQRSKKLWSFWLSHTDALISRQVSPCLRVHWRNFRVGVDVCVFSVCVFQTQPPLHRSCAESSMSPLSERGPRSASSRLNWGPPRTTRVVRAARLTRSRWFFTTPVSQIFSSVNQKHLLDRDTRYLRFHTDQLIWKLPQSQNSFLHRSEDARLLWLLWLPAVTSPVSRRQ